MKRQLIQLSPPRADAAIDRVNHAGGIAGAVGSKERHQVSDFPRMCGAAERKALLKLLVADFVAELVLRAGLEQGVVAFGAYRAGIGADLSIVVDHALGSECP